MSKVTLYTAPTPNGHPISILLEELGVPYETKRLSISDADIGKVHDQVKSPWFLEINPNGRIPAITHDGFNVFETSAILLYLAAEFDKEGKVSYKPEDGRKYFEQVEWLFFVHGGIGPMQGQANHFSRLQNKIEYGITRYVNETRRLYGVLEAQLAKHEYIVGDKYTIADIKAFPWVRRSEVLGIDVGKEFPKIQAWLDRINARPAVQAGLKVPA